MDTLLLIYFIALSMELVLSVGMLILLWLIIAPRGAARPTDTASSTSMPQPEPLPHAPAAALNAAFRSISRDDNELAVLVNTRDVLARAIAEARQ